MSKVIMVLPKRTITKSPLLPEGHELKDGCLYDEQKRELGQFRLEEGQEFGTGRRKLVLECPSDDGRLIHLLASAAALAYENEPSRYPLYVVLDSEALETIRTLSRLEFLPYMGIWQLADEKQSEDDWNEILNRLRA